MSPSENEDYYYYMCITKSQKKASFIPPVWHSSVNFKVKQMSCPFIHCNVQGSS